MKSQQRGLVSQKDLGKHASLAQRKSEGNQLQRMSALFPLRQRYFYLQKRQNNCILPWAPAPLASFFFGFWNIFVVVVVVGIWVIWHYYQSPFKRIYFLFTDSTFSWGHGIGLLDLIEEFFCVLQIQIFVWLIYSWFNKNQVSKIINSRLKLMTQQPKAQTGAHSVQYKEVPTCKTL